MKTKVITKQFMDLCHDDKFMLEYIDNMQQEIYQFTVPEFFIGLKFKDCVTMLYIYGVDLSKPDFKKHDDGQDIKIGDRKMTAFAVETLIKR